MGRKTKLTEEVQQAIVDAVAVGATYADAAALGGVTYETFRNWLLLGQAGRVGKYSAFFNAVRHAEATCRVKMTATIYDAGITAKDWRAALEFLKRRSREEWGDHVDLTSKQQSLAPAAAEVNLALLSTQDLIMLEQLLQKAGNAENNTRS